MSFRDLAENIVNFLNFSVIPLLFALAMLFFVYGVARYFIIDKDAVESRGNAVQMMTYGIIGLAVMTGMWGLVAIIRNTLGI